MSALRIIVHGATGRMGRELVRLIDEDEDLDLIAAVSTSPGKVQGYERVAQLPERRLGADVLVDFSSPAGFREALEWCVDQRRAFVSGTTDLGEEEHAALESAARDIPVLWAPNMSLGVAVLERLAAEATRLLGEDADIEILESHHAGKVDSPSGTALRLAEEMAQVRHQDPESQINPTRSGIREPGEIGIVSQRGGDVVGDHSISFLLPTEKLELKHHARRRSLFARGALRAARWIVDQPPGRYRFGDVLGEA